MINPPLMRNWMLPPRKPTKSLKKTSRKPLMSPKMRKVNLISRSQLMNQSKLMMKSSRMVRLMPRKMRRRMTIGNMNFLIICTCLR